MKKFTLFILACLCSLGIYGQTEEVATFAELSKAISDGKPHITVTESIDMSGTLTIARDITIKGANETIMLKGEATESTFLFKITATATNVSFENLTFDGNEKNGAIFFESKGSNLSLTNVTFKNHIHAAYGIESSRTQYGGAVVIKGNAKASTFQMKDCLFENNDLSLIDLNNGVESESQNKGGAAITAISNVSIKAENCRFENNKSRGLGGAISYRTGESNSNTSPATLNFTKCEFNNNEVYGHIGPKADPDGSGGAIYIRSYESERSVTQKVNLIIKEGAFSNNKAYRHGGAIYMRGHVETNIADNAIFTNNEAKENGGAIYALDSNREDYKDEYTHHATRLSNTTFSDNKAKGGGAVYANQRPLIIEGSTFKNNSSKYSGGAIDYTFDPIRTEGELIIDHSTFSDNNADTSGGAIVASSKTRITAEKSVQMTIDNSIFEKNISTNGGGAIFLQDGNTIFQSDNCTFTGNQQASSFVDEDKGGGAVHIRAFGRGTDPNTGFNNKSKSTFKITKGVFEENSAKSNGGAVFIDTAIKVDIADSKFNNNQAKELNGGAIHFYTGKKKAYEKTEDTYNYFYQALTIDNVSFTGNTAGIGRFLFKKADYPDLANTYENNIKNVSSLSTPFDPIENIAYNNYDITFVADKYTITYFGNQNTEGDAPVDDTIYLINEEVTVKEQGNLKKDNSVFLGWNTLRDGSGTAYKANDKFQIIENMLLFAQWGKSPTDPTDPTTPPTFHYIVDLIAPPVECGCYTYDPAPGRYAVKAGDCFTVNISYEYCCFPEYTFEVFVNGELTAPKDSSEFLITYEVCDIRENKVIEVIATKVDCTVGIDATDAQNAIWTEAGMICIQSETNTHATIYSISGQVVWEGPINAGVNRISLTKGFYIVQSAGSKKGVKVIVI